MSTTATAATTAACGARTRRTRPPRRRRGFHPLLLSRSALTRPAAQFLNQKDALVFLIDATEGMLSPAATPRPKNWPDDLPWRALDLAILVAHKAMRSKCV